MGTVELQGKLGNLLYQSGRRTKKESQKGNKWSRELMS